MKSDETVFIAENKQINEKYYKLSFRSKKLARGAKPGQFLQIQIQPTEDPLLRRPFSYYGVTEDKIEILYEVLGRGTKLLSDKKKGDTLRVLGPLGKPFTPKVKGRKRVLIAGGIGVPPLVYLAEHHRVDYLLIGTKSKSEVLPAKELKRAKAKILYSTNDGSYGKKGYVTVLLEEIIEKEGAENLFVQMCGPNVMMRTVMAICRKHEIEGEASLDKEMACGVGVCLGCMVRTPKGWVPSCTEGPVFRFEDIVEI